MVDRAKIHLDKCDDNSFRDCFLQVNLQYLEELLKLHSNYFLAPNKLNIKK